MRTFNLRVPVPTIQDLKSLKSRAVAAYNRVKDVPEDSTEERQPYQVIKIKNMNSGEVESELMNLITKEIVTLPVKLGEYKDVVYIKK
jgi:hypothetical protein